MTFDLFLVFIVIVVVKTLTFEHSVELTPSTAETLHLFIYAHQNSESNYRKQTSLLYDPPTSCVQVILHFDILSLRFSLNTTASGNVWIEVSSAVGRSVTEKKRKTKKHHLFFSCLIVWFIVKHLKMVSV